MSTGYVVLVGAGPGDPDLLTLKGVQALTAADVVVYDRLVNKAIFRHVSADAERIDVGKRPGKHPVSQDRINRILIERARVGKRVVRLKGGDPFVFGRGGEEALALAEAGIPFEVVPGVTAGTAVPASAGIPVTHRGLASCVTFVTGHEDPTKDASDLDYDVLAKTGGTLVLYMGVKRLAEIAGKLIEAGLPADTPTACIENGTLPEQRSVRGTLADIAAKVAKTGIAPPAVTVVGAVAGLPETLNWFEHRPLFRKRIVVTRPADQAVAMSGQLSRLGAKVIELATVEIVDPPSWKPVDAALRDLDTFDWVVFTSANGAEAFDRRMCWQGLRLSDATHVCLAAIGRATADVLSRFRPPDLVPDDFTSTGLLEAFRVRVDLKDKRVLLPRSGIARPELREGLEKLGARVTEVTVYTTRTHTSPDPDTVEAIRHGECDVVTFTSSSTVRGFVEIVGRDAVRALRGKVQFASIGPVTSETCRELDIPVGVEAREHTTDGLLHAILDNVSRG